jgi:DNA-binding HxlR family transcriptional regulator
MEICETSSRDTTDPCRDLVMSVDDAFYALGGKWTLRILVALSTGDKKFNQLQHALGGISARVLSNNLKDLEMLGFLLRDVQPGAIKGTAFYKLTDYSLTLKGVITELSKWGKFHRQNLRENHRS